MIATSAGPRTWIGTREYSQWIDTPLSGADMSPDGWGVGGTLLNGGGWQKKSFGSHKTYQLSWRSSSTREAAAIMQGYYSGTWGEGLIHFHDPLTYDTNVLPAGWADPSLATRGGFSHIPGLTPTASRFTWGNRPYNFRLQNYPLNWTRYEIPAGASVVGRRLYVPIPEGHSLHLGAVWQGTPSVALKVRRVKADGVTYGPAFTLESVPSYDERVTTSEIVGGTDAGVEIWIEKTGTLSGTIDIKAMTGRLLPSFRQPDVIQLGPWVGGQGNSGCEFDGVPTLINHTGVNGGQVSYAATLKEVGSWL